MATVSEKKVHLDSIKKALTTVIEALEGLDEKTQRRVLDAATVFYEIGPKTVLRGEWE